MPWRTGLCGCTNDIPACFDIVCCGPCAIGRQCNAVKGQPDTLDIIPCICGLIPAVAVIEVLWIRLEVKKRFMLTEDESFLGSLCSACCFAPCSLCQTSRELNLQDTRTGHTCFAQVQPSMN